MIPFRKRRNFLTKVTCMPRNRHGIDIFREMVFVPKSPFKAAAIGPNQKGAIPCLTQYTRILRYSILTCSLYPARVKFLGTNSK